MVDAPRGGRAVGAIVVSRAAGPPHGAPLAGWIAQTRGLRMAVALAGGGFAVAAARKIIRPRPGVSADGVLADAATSS
jgi:hypothetical protein